MKQKAQVVLLPTDKYAKDFPKELTLHFNSKIHLIQAHGSLSYAHIQHLYVISNEEVKNNELPCWCINKNHDTLYQVQTDGTNWYKVIATTNLEIAIEKDTLSIPQRRGLTNHYPVERKVLPQIPQSFISTYITEYNKGHIIENVEVEYNDVIICESTENYDDNDLFVNGQKIRSYSHKFPEVLQRDADTFKKVKVNPDNTINISIIKETWTREEVIALIHKYVDNSVTKSPTINSIFHEQANEWINQNL